MLIGQDIIDVVKIDAIQHQPFFASGGLKMKWIVDNAISTACVDGISIRFNEEFLNKLTMEERIFVALHEVMHIYSKHHLRLDGRNPELWNISGDFVINLTLYDAIQGEIQRRGKSCMAMPKEVLFDEKFRGWSTEQVYDYFKKDCTEEEINAMFKKASLTGLVEQFDGTGEEKSEQETNVELMVEQAVNLAKAQGKLPKGAEELIQSYKETKVDWRTVLKNIMQSLVPTDFTYNKINRNRYHLYKQGIIVADFHKESVGEIVICCDTSGSVDDNELKQFLAEMRFICDDLQPSKTHVVQCDTEINHIDTFHQGELFNVTKIHGRGGTDFEPVFDWIEEEFINPMAVVYLTDGECDAPSNIGNYPVFWGVTGSYNADHLKNTGEVLKIDLS